MMNPMTEDRTQLQWPKLAAAVRAAREARGLRQVDLANLSGVSLGTIQNLEDPARRPGRIPQSLAKVEPHLGWPTGTAMAIVREEELPAGSGADPAPAPAKNEIRSKLPLRIVDELESDDPLLDSAVIALPGTDGARMTVVVHGRQDATPAQIQEALLAWRRTERRLHRLSGDEDDEAQAANEG